MRIRIGKSPSPVVDRAVREAVGEARQRAEGARFALVFATDQYDADSLAAAVSRELGEIPWAGCYTAGVFVGTEMLRQGLVVGVLCGEDIQVGVGVGGPVSRDARAAGRAAVAEALAALSPLPPSEGGRAMILLPDALTGNVAEVVRGAAHEAGAGVIWAGGGAGDNLRFVRTVQFAHGRAYDDRVVVVAVDSRARVATGIQHGWQPYGPPTLVTRSRGATVVELEYESAFEVYRRTAASRGDEISKEGFASFAMTHPLGIPQADGRFVIRDPLTVEPDGSLRCVAEVPDGSLVRVMQGEDADLLDASRAAATATREALGGQAGGALVFECVSRFLTLKERIRDELSTIQEGIGADVPVMGCLTFGEVGAFGAGVPQFHNKTTVVLALPR